MTRRKAAWLSVLLTAMFAVTAAPTLYQGNEFILFDQNDNSKMWRLDLTGLNTGSPIIWTAAQQSGIVAVVSTEGNANDVLASGGGGGSTNLWKSPTSDLGLVEYTGTAGRVPFAQSAHVLIDDADMTFATDVLTVTKLAVPNYATIGGSGATTDVVETISGVSSQTGDLVQWKDATAMRNRIDASGGLNYAKKNLTGQTADIGATGIATSAQAGFYLVDATLNETTSDLAAGAVTLTIAWTDDTGATTATAGPVALTGLGTLRATLSQVVYLASGNVTYAVSHSGVYGTAQYALRIRLTFLGS